MTESLKDRYAIAGIGQSRIGKVPELDDYGLQLTAVKNALDDAGLKKQDIDGLITHSHLLGAVRVHHQRVAERLGIDTVSAAIRAPAPLIPTGWIGARAVVQETMKAEGLIK